MKTHEIKIWPEFYQAIIEGRKTFEFRKNDRDFNVGDSILLKEWNPENKKYTGRIIGVEITYILGDDSNIQIPKGFVIMSIREFKNE